MNPGLELLRIYIKFLDKLSPEEIKALEAGRAGLALAQSKAQAAARKRTEPSTALIRKKIEGQKKEPGGQSLAWLNKYRKDSLWRLIKSYKLPPATRVGLSSASPKRLMIEFLELAVLGRDLNKSGIADIDLDDDWGLDPARSDSGDRPAAGKF